jgi:hypothetical protein
MKPHRKRRVAQLEMARPKDARRIVVLSQIGEPAWRDAEGWSPLFMDTAHIWTRPRISGPVRRRRWSCGITLTYL